jgi:hypothetical protein
MLALVLLLLATACSLAVAMSPPEQACAGLGAHTQAQALYTNDTSFLTFEQVGVITCAFVTIIMYDNHKKKKKKTQLVCLIPPFLPAPFLLSYQTLTFLFLCHLILPGSAPPSLQAEARRRSFHGQLPRRNQLQRHAGAARRRARLCCIGYSNWMEQHGPY